MNEKQFDPSENLIPASERSLNEVRENGRKGGIASGKARRRKRDMKVIAETILAMQVKKGQATNIDTIRSIGELKGKNVNVEEAMVIAVAQNALKGDLNAIRLLMEITGQKPKEEIEVNATVTNEGKLDSILKQLKKRKEEDE